MSISRVDHESISLIRQTNVSLKQKKKKKENCLRSLVLSRVTCTNSYCILSCRIVSICSLVLPDRRAELSKGNGDVQVPRLLRDTVAGDNWILSGDGTTPRTLH